MDRVILRSSPDNLRRSYLKSAVGTPARTLVNDAGPARSMLFRGKFDPTLELNYVDDPRLAVGETFVRATIATMVDFEGRIRTVQASEARFYGMRRVENLLDFTEDASNAYWTKDDITLDANVIAGGFNNPRADKLVETVANSDHRLQATTATGVVGKTYVTSFRVKAAERTSCAIQVNGLANSTAVFNLVAATVTSTQAAVAAADVFAVGDGFVRCWIRWACTNAAQFPELALVDANGNIVYVGTPGAGLYWRQAQHQDVTGATYQGVSEYQSKRILPAPYQGANVDGVRYFPTKTDNKLIAPTVTDATQTRKGLWGEQASKNCVVQSEDHSATWVAVGTPTRTAAGIVLGSLKLDLIGDDDALALEGYTQAIAFTGDGVKGISVFVSKDTSASSVVRLRDTTGAADRLLAAITWIGAVPSVAMTTGTLLGVFALGLGVYRIEMLSTAVTAANNNSLEGYPATDAALAVANVGRIYWGGWQAENIAKATSYIPTTVAAVTRNDETAAVNTLFSSWYNQAEGTVVVKAMTHEPTAGGNRAVVAINDTTPNEVVNVFLNSLGTRQLSLMVLDGGVSQAQINNVETPAADVMVRAALAFKLNDFAGVVNGGAIINDVAGTLPTPTTMQLMQHVGGSILNGALARVWVYDKRVPDALLRDLMAGY